MTYEKRNIDEDTIEILALSITSNTKRQYDSVLKFWWEFCITEDLDIVKADENAILRCLTKKYQDGASYIVLNTLRSAISLINSVDTSESKIISRFFRAIALERPPAPMYDSTWNVDAVLNEIRKWGNNENLNLQNLSLKLVMLLDLGSAYRTQSIVLIKISNIKITATGAELRISDRIKTTKPGDQHPYTFFPFFEQPDLCIARTIIKYLEKTRDLRGKEDYLIISFRQPFKKVTTQTISRWLKLVMSKAGIDIFSSFYSSCLDIKSEKKWLKHMRNKKGSSLVREFSSFR